VNTVHTNIGAHSYFNNSYSNKYIYLQKGPLYRPTLRLGLGLGLGTITVKLNCNYNCITVTIQWSLLLIDTPIIKIVVVAIAIYTTPMYVSPASDSKHTLQISKTQTSFT